MRCLKLTMSLITLGITLPLSAGAEGDPLVFADVFGGYAWNSNQDLDVRTTFLGAPANVKFDNLDITHGPTFGGRIGMWLQSRPSVGIAIDATRFDTDIDNQTTRIDVVSPPLTGPVTTGSGDMRIANVLASIDFIYRWQGPVFTPYAMVGPGIIFSSFDDSDGALGLQNDDNDVSFGFKVGAGISYKISDTMHIFTEYRYISGSPEYEANTTDFNLGQNAFTTVNSDIDMDIDSHLAIGGLSIRF